MRRLKIRVTVHQSSMRPDWGRMRIGFLAWYGPFALSASTMRTQILEPPTIRASAT